MHAFWLVLTYDLLEDRRIDDVNISDTLGCASCATFLFLPHFDVLCDLLLNRRTATWNLFVKQRHGNRESIYSFLSFNNNM